MGAQRIKELEGSNPDHTLHDEGVTVMHVEGAQAQETSQDEAHAKRIIKDIKAPSCSVDRMTIGKTENGQHIAQEYAAERLSNLALRDLSHDHSYLAKGSEVAMRQAHVRSFALPVGDAALQNAGQRHDATYESHLRAERPTRNAEAR
jgi:hypothetical protein